MISYSGYTNEELRNALFKLKDSPKTNDFVLIEQIETELRKRGKNPAASYYGKDVLGSMIKTMKSEQHKHMDLKVSKG